MIDGRINEITRNAEGKPIALALQFKDRSKAKVKVCLTAMLGSGSFGSVYKATGFDGNTIAVKLADGAHSRLVAEVELMSKAQSTRCPEFYFAAFSADKGTVAIGMELCTGLTLHDLLVSHSVTAKRDLVWLFREVLEAIHSVHERKVCHHDVKLQNFAFDHNGNLKLIDFGMACPTDRVQNVVGGTPSFMAPEMATNAVAAAAKRRERIPVGIAADVWSAGVVLVSILTRKSPYPKGADQTALIKLVSEGDYTFPPHSASHQKLGEMIRTMLQRDPSARPTLPELLAELPAPDNKGVPRLVGKFLQAHADAEEAQERGYASLAAICLEEATQRHLLEQQLEFALEELSWCIWVQLEEVNMRVELEWAISCQKEYAVHPHRFIVKNGVPRGYECGFICDGCGESVDLRRGSRFAHCSCGMDLCIVCHIAYQDKCTCTCGKTFANIQQRDRHDCLEKRIREGGGSGEVLAQQRRRREPLGTVSDPNAAHWQVFDGMSSKRDSKKERPTAEEQRLLLQGDWIQYFHLYPEGDMPAAFVYHIQPGRTGGIFLSNESAVHSVVSSPMEAQCHVVQSIDAESGQDVCDGLATEVAQSYYPSEMKLLNSAIMHDNSMLKQRRAPGTMSVYQIPRTAVRCFGEAFVYVRWMLHSPADNVTLIALSNGFVQVFLHNGMEVRWFGDGERKFVVRSSGRCELVEADASFMPVVNKLLGQEISELDS